MAAGEGFEPSHTESESAVLPLHKPAILRCYHKRKSYYTKYKGIVKRFGIKICFGWEMECKQEDRDKLGPEVRGNEALSGSERSAEGRA